MTRVFVYEHATATAAGSDPAASLLREGRAMLEAAAADFAAMPGVAVDTLSMADFPGEDEGFPFRRKVAVAEFTLVIAPETDGVLEERCRWVKQAGGSLLGPTPDAVRLTADKLALGRYLRTAGVPTPRTWELGGPAEGAFPLAVKPRYGAGSVDTHRVDGPGRLGELESQGVGGRVAQEWVRGRPASAAFLVGESDLIALPPCWQHFAPGPDLEYVGGELPLPPDLAARCDAVARPAVRAVPGLRGYVGVDVVLGDFGRDWVIEINPRLTTSYVGLRRLSEANLADVMLALARKRPPPPVRFRPGSVRFFADGSVEEL